MSVSRLRRGRPLALGLGGLLTAPWLAGCGTDVQDLLRADAEMAWQADALMAEAHAQDPAMAADAEAAEEEKIQACSEITEAVQREIRGDAEEQDLGEEILTDIGEFVTWALPVGPQEDCAEAQERYHESIMDLERRLQAMDSAAEPPV